MCPQPLQNIYIPSEFKVKRFKNRADKIHRSQKEPILSLKSLVIEQLYLSVVQIMKYRGAINTHTRIKGRHHSVHANREHAHRAHANTDRTKCEREI